MPSLKEIGGPSQIIQFRNCWLLRDHEIIKDDLWIRDGKILNPEKLFFDEKKAADIQIDCGGVLISPGFIDVQCNGAFGVDFSDVHSDIAGRLEDVTKGLLAHGVTSFCPTIITLPAEHYKKILPQIQKREGGKHGTGILGLHLEGPFISVDKKGAHPAEHIYSPENGLSDLQDMYGECLENAVILTLAPELPGAMEAIAGLKKMGIIVSVGHSTANLACGEEAVENGVTFITHLFNAMLPFHHRDPHLVGLLASDQIPTNKTVYYGMISDGIHTDGSAIRIAYRTHPKGIVVVTDSVPAMGLSVGVHQLGIQKVNVRRDSAVIFGTDTLCGSVATMNECVKFFHKATGCSKVEALETVTLHPAELLEISNKKGTLGYDSDADFVFLNDDLTVVRTYIGGEMVWEDTANNQAKITKRNI